MGSANDDKAQRQRGIMHTRQYTHQKKLTEKKIKTGSIIFALPHWTLINLKYTHFPEKKIVMMSLLMFFGDGMIKINCVYSERLIIRNPFLSLIICENLLLALETLYHARMKLNIFYLQ